MSTVRYHTIAASAGGRTSVMHLPPTAVKKPPRKEVFTASGYRKLLGSEWRELYWSIADPLDMNDIFSRTGGRAASCILGYLRTKDWVSRASTYESWSDYVCFLDQPEEGDWQIGDLRYNLMVRCRRMVVYQELSE